MFSLNIIFLAKFFPPDCKLFLTNQLCISDVTETCITCDFLCFESNRIKCMRVSVLSQAFTDQPCHNTRSSSTVTLARPPTCSSLKITNRSFRYAAPCLWNELPTDLREPRQIQSPSLSPITHASSSSSSSPSSLSPFASSLTRPVFHSELMTWLFGKSFPQ